MAGIALHDRYGFAVEWPEAKDANGPFRSAMPDEQTAKRCAASDKLAHAVKSLLVALLSADIYCDAVLDAGEALDAAGIARPTFGAEAAS